MVIEGIALAMSVVALMMLGLIAFWLILYRFYLLFCLQEPESLTGNVIEKELGLAWWICSRSLWQWVALTPPELINELILSNAKHFCRTDTRKEVASSLFWFDFLIICLYFRVCTWVEHHMFRLEYGFGYIYLLQECRAWADVLVYFAALCLGYEKTFCHLLSIIYIIVMACYASVSFLTEHIKVSLRAMVLLNSIVQFLNLMYG